MKTNAIHSKKIQNSNLNGLSGKNSLVILVIIMVMAKNDFEDDKNNFEFKNDNNDKTKKKKLGHRPSPQLDLSTLRHKQNQGSIHMISYQTRINDTVSLRRTPTVQPR